MNKARFWLVGAVILTSCGQATLEDISSDGTYSHLIGNEYKSIVDLVIHGVTTDPKYDDEVDYYSVETEPGTSGPEIIFKDLLPAETVIRIDKAMVCTNCIGKGIHFQVKILSTDSYRDRPVMIVDEVGIDFAEDDNGEVRVNSRLFVEIAD